MENIDEEHKYLFELLNKAHVLATTDYHGDYYQRIKEMMAELDSYAELHFGHEEEYMTQIRDPELFSQRKQHAFFREKILALDLVNIDDIVTVLNELKVCIAEHFGDEEAYMESIHYEGIDAQKRAHTAYLEKLGNINRDEALANPQKYFQKLIEFLIGWLIDHITKVDKKIPAAMP